MVLRVTTTAILVAALAPTAALAKGLPVDLGLATNARGDAVVAWSRGDGQAGVGQVAGLAPRSRILTMPSAYADPPAVALDAAGGLWRAWGEGSSRTSTIVLARGMGAARTIARSPDAGLLRPQVAADGRGAVVAWLAARPRGLALWAASAHGAPVMVAPALAGAGTFRLAGGGGRPVLAWYAAGPTPRLVVAERTPEGRWPRRALGDAERGAADLAVAGGPGGRAAVAWRARDGRAMVAERGPSGRWDAPRRLGPGAGAREIGLAYGPDGALHAAFTVGELGDAAVWRAAAGGAATRLSRPGAVACHPRIAAGRGSVAVAWMQSRDWSLCDAEAYEPGVPSTVAAAVGGGRARAVSGRARHGDLRVAIGPDGRPRLAWNVVAGEAVDGLGVRVAAYRGAGGWTAPRDMFDRARDVVPPGQSLWELRVADGRWTARLWVGDAAGVAVALGPAGGEGGMRPRPVRVGRAGDALVDLGALAPGAYRLRVVARDRHGNASTLEHRILTQFAGLRVGGDGPALGVDFGIARPTSLVARLWDPAGRRVLRVLAVGRVGPGRHHVAVGALPAGGALLELRAAGRGESPIVLRAPLASS